MRTPSGIASLGLPGFTASAEILARAPDGEFLIEGVFAAWPGLGTERTGLLAVLPSGHRDRGFADRGLADLGYIQAISLAISLSGKPVFSGYNPYVDDFNALYRIKPAA